jgi:uncharacterized protein (UPF0297 family)
VPSALTTFRQAVITELNDDPAFDGYRFVPGRIVGPVRKPIGCVFPGEPSYVEREENVQTAILRLEVRVFVGITQQRDVEKPLDPTVLEELGEAVMLALRDRDTVALGVWYSRVTGYTIDLEAQGVYAEVIGWNDNVFTAL